MSQKIYDLITDRIIDLLEKGVIPWRKPWDAASGAPRNLVSGKAYRGINAILLASLGFSSSWFATFHQIKALGGSVKKGMHGIPVVFWKFLEAATEPGGDDDQSDRRERVPLLRYYTVFNLDQTEGIPAGKIPALETCPFEPLTECERIVAEMPMRPEIRHTTENRAYYRPSADLVNMPLRESFHSAADYYNSLFHELTHSTGHASRLARKSLETWAPFGTADYSREELVAEMGAGFLCAHASLESSTLENTAAYIQSWLQVLKDDRRAVIVAAGQAQRAADYILGNPSEDEPTH